MSAGTPMIEKASAGMREIFSAFTTSEARYFDEERYSEAELRKSLADALTDKKIDAMKRLLAAVSVGRDASPLFPDVVKNVSFQSLELKKLIYIYLVQYAENNRDLALLSINSFQKDLYDRSQLVRASALRAMASIKVLEVIQLVMVAVKNASVDSSPYVRKTAAQCMTKVYAVDPDQFFELRGLLLKLMSDTEVQVVGSAVMAFHHICIVQPPRMPEEALSSETTAMSVGGLLVPDAVAQLQLALLHPHFKRLCSEVLLMDSWAQQSCVDMLVRYSRLFFACPNARPQEEQPRAEGADAGEVDEQSSKATSLASPSVSEDLVTFLRALKLLLSSSSQGVTLAAAAGLCYLAPSEDLSVVTRPLLQCLRQAHPESAHALLSALGPVIEARPDLIRPSIREFFVQSFDFPAMKELKLKVIEKLVDETNVQLVLRELQAYVSWHSMPEFVALAVQSIAHVALKISSVADHCLRGLVRMLDAKCEALACEAVVALRALLQQRHESSDSGLGSVLPHLVRYLEDLSAPSARASVVWIIGQYQHEVPRLAADVVRRLAKTFATERQEVKQQTLVLGLKVWAFHALSSWEQTVASTGGKVPAAVGKQPGVTPQESAKLLPRLEALVDHVANVASYDSAWDVRDTARALRHLKDAAKQGLDAGDEAVVAGSLEAFGLAYCRACVRGVPLTDNALASVSAGALANGQDGMGQSLESSWILGSLAQALDFPLDTYRSLPAWAHENSSDELRMVKVEAKPPPPVKSISSSNVGQSQHMEKRAQNPSNITNLPVVQNLEDLDLFYSQDTANSGRLGAAAAAAGRLSGGGACAMEPSATLEQMRLHGDAAPPCPVGTAVFGEDDESEEEDEPDSDGESWLYCQQAAGQVLATTRSPANEAPAAAPELPSPQPQEQPQAVLPTSSQTPEQPSFQPAPRTMVDMSSVAEAAALEAPAALGPSSAASVYTPAPLPPPDPASPAQAALPTTSQTAEQPPFHLPSHTAAELAAPVATAVPAPAQAASPVLVSAEESPGAQAADSPAAAAPVSPGSPAELPVPPALSAQAAPASTAASAAVFALAVPAAPISSDDEML